MDLRGNYNMYCQVCGKEVTGNFCQNCGNKVSDEVIMRTQTIIQQPQYQNQSILACPRCHSHNISVQTISESRKSGCGTIILYILLTLTIFGILIIIPLLLRKKTETNTYCVCQNCGNRWKR